MINPQDFLNNPTCSKLNIRRRISYSNGWGTTGREIEDETFYVIVMLSRGGVEDTRLEAKAKDTKKIRGQGQGQGQPFRGQTLSKPRTGMLEAKAKDQGHKRKCSPKKKKRSSQKFFRRSPKKKKINKKKGLHKNFSSDLHKKTFSKKFFKRFTKF